MMRVIRVEFEPIEGGIDWRMSWRDIDWLEGLRWKLELVQIAPETWADYHEYLRSTRWQRRRREALALADYRCGVCNAGDTTLDVHHRTYERIGRERSTDLVVLCRDCHDIFHRNGKLARG